MTYAAINGKRVVEMDLQIPHFGNWHADVLFDEPEDIDGVLTLTLGDLTMAGKFLRGGSFHGSFRVRLVGGAGGWPKAVGPKFYQLPTGVRMGTVLVDAAREVGERVTLEADASVGAFFVREQGPAARLFGQLGARWFMQPDGVTRVGARAATPIASRFDVISADLSNGRIVVATDAPEDWTPGRHFSTPTLSDRTISHVRHIVGRTEVRTEVMTTP